MSERNSNRLILSEFWIYPVKSLGGIRLPSAKVLGKGLQYDRRFMLVDEGGMFMTQRVFPKMALFKVSINDDQITVTHGAETISFPAVPSNTQPAKPVQIWDDLVMGNEVSPDVSQWFSYQLGMPCRLVFFPEENPRPVDAQYKVNDEHVGFADAYPLLIIGQSSLDDLNSRLADPLPMNRFRPNLVFTGGEAYEEDNWRNFTVGKTRFIGVKPCARCVLTTVNQDTGVKSAEPLRTLASYRSRNNKIYFGQNVVVVDPLEIREGDAVTLQ
jgi:uncharacterized protein